jgi:hypothetical protein
MIVRYSGLCGPGLGRRSALGAEHYLGSDIATRRSPASHPDSHAGRVCSPGSVKSWSLTASDRARLPAGDAPGLRKSLGVVGMPGNSRCNSAMADPVDFHHDTPNAHQIGVQATRDPVVHRQCELPRMDRGGCHKELRGFGRSRQVSEFLTYTLK